MPSLADQQCSDVCNGGNADPAQVNAKTGLNKSVRKVFYEYVDPDQADKQSCHEYERKRQSFIVPRHYPQPVEEACKAEEPSDTADCHLVRGGELDNAEYQQQDVDDTPD